MAARKLTDDQQAKLRLFAGRLADEEGLGPADIARRWNDPHEGHPAERGSGGARLTSRAVCYHLLAMRRARLAEAADHVAALTDRTVQHLAAVAHHDPRAIQSWGPDGVELRDSDDLHEMEAAAVAAVTCEVVERTYVEDGREITERKTRTTVTPHPKVAAGNALLRFLHGSTLNVHDSGAIIARLIQAGDREGLRRIAAGEDAVKVLIDRAPHLRVDKGEE